MVPVKAGTHQADGFYRAHVDGSLPDSVESASRPSVRVGTDLMFSSANKFLVHENSSESDESDKEQVSQDGTDTDRRLI